MSAPVETIVVAERDAGMRLDRWFKQHFPTVGHSYLQKLLRTGQIRLDSRRCEANARIEAGQQIRVPKVIREAPKPTAGAHPSPKPPMGLSKADRTFIENAILYE
ncbi:MAG: RluA family pseudouridine synthase, partial [Proteobacteria bacterium]|nr:RluA family pseudouridine synthase [Pseudomonadota bacterium]